MRKKVQIIQNGGDLMNSASYNEILHYLKLDSVFYSRSTLGGDKWGIDLPAFKNTSMFHIVTSGSCVVEIGGNTYHLRTGDLVFISRAHGHAVKGSEKAKATDLFAHPIKRVSPCYETLELHPEEKDQTTILCGVVKITHPAGEMLINEMPDIIAMMGVFSLNHIGLKPGHIRRLLAQPVLSFGKRRRRKIQYRNIAIAVS